MELAQFVDSRRPRWSRLEALLRQAETDGLKKFTLGECQEFSRLYRSVSGDLLWAKSQYAADDVTQYLNDVVGRAYAVSYPGQPFRLGAIGRFIIRGYPDLVLREWRMFVAAIMFFVAGVGFGYLGMWIDPDATPYIIDQQHQTLDPVERAKSEETSSVASIDSQSGFASFLMTHNIQVSILAFALGLTAGVGTALLLFINGITLGSLAYSYASKGLAGWFWAWILPHGIPEISAICLAGAAGFLIARGILTPSGQSRRVTLRVQAQKAVQMLMGTMILFVVAGIVEGTISQIHPPKLSVLFKISFAVTLGLVVYAYLFSALFRRQAHPTTGPLAT